MSVEYFEQLLLKFRGVFNIYDAVFFWKNLTVKISIIDVRQGPKYSSEVIVN